MWSVTDCPFTRAVLVSQSQTKQWPLHFSPQKKNKYNNVFRYFKKQISTIFVHLVNHVDPDSIPKSVRMKESGKYEQSWLNRWLTDPSRRSIGYSVNSHYLRSNNGPSPPSLPSSLSIEITHTSHSHTFSHASAPRPSDDPLPALSGGNCTRESAELWVN